MIEYVNSEERALVEVAREFARDRLRELDRQCDRDESSICVVLPQMAEMGFLSLRLPESVGGLGCNRLAYAAILHEIAYASPSACVTISVHNLVGEMLSRLGGERIQAEILPQMGQAESLGALAVSEADAGSDAASSATRAVKRGGQWLINGAKMWITNGVHGRWFVTLVQTRQIGDKHGLCMILVDGRQQGLERLKIEGKMGIRGSETVSLHLTDVRAPLDHLLGEEGSGLKQALMALNGGRIGVAAQATGIAEACLDEMVGYARQRVQFGQPIARFQAIQTMVADSASELAAAKALIARACTLAGDDDGFIAAAAKAKLYATEMACRVADRAVQVHGGTGYVNDTIVEKLYRDVRVTRIYEGTSEIQRVVITRELLPDSLIPG
ncbi:MAG: acyl-CoA dehydrogenase family protein [Phycisphaerales bacterium]|nr:MAG: acyl-CoA dehydrogenase family protein [Phycisphaerales bacterium]